MNAVQPVLEYIWQQSWQAAVAAGLVLLARFFFRGWIGARWGYALWLIVLARLILPSWPASPFSVFNLPGWFARIEKHEPLPMRDAGNAVLTSVRSDGQMDPTIAPPAPWGGERRAAGISSQTLWQFALVGLWLSGAACVGGWMMHGHRRFRRILSRSSARADSHWMKILDDCRRISGINRPVELCITDAVESPALAGLWRPRILLPPGLAAELPERQMRLVFLHELAHLRCGDLWLDFLWSILLSMHWFNPLLWISGACFRADREQARDAMVLRQTREAQDYGQTLIRIIERVSHAFPQPGVIAMAGARGTLRRRVAMIARFDDRPRRGRWIALLALALLCLTRARAQQPAPAATQPSNQTTQMANVDDLGLANVLKANLPPLNLDHVPLAGLVTYLGDIGGYNMDIEYRALGIDFTTPISLHMANAKLSEVLDEMLKQSGAEKFAIDMDRGVITVSTPDDLREMREIEAEEDDSNDNDSDWQKINRKLPSVSFPSVNLSDAVQFLQDVTGWNIAVQWDALATADVEKKSQITLMLHDVSTAKILDMMLRQVGQRKVGYVVSQGQITISTWEALDKMPILRIYQLQKVIDHWPSEAGNTQSPLDQMQAMVRKQVAWDAGDTIERNPGELAITQTPKNQQKIRELMEEWFQEFLPVVRVETKILELNDVPEAKEVLEKFLRTSDPGVMSNAQMNESLLALRQWQASITHAPLVHLRDSAMIVSASPTKFEAPSSRSNRRAPGGKPMLVPQTAMEGAKLSATIVSADPKQVKLDLDLRLSHLTAIELLDPNDKTAGQRAVGTHLDLKQTVTFTGDNWLVLRGDVQNGVGIKTGNEQDGDWTIPTTILPGTAPDQPKVDYILIRATVLPPSK